MTYPRYYRSPWPSRLLIVGAAVAAIGLLVITVLSLIAASQWCQ